jgi:predicted flap endonuclease-1-like 5' DNA nuclease
MSGLGCCIWWFLFGALLGWLASWLLGKLIGKGPTEVARAVPAPVAAPAPRTTDGIDYAAARAAGFVVSGVDNLEVIEGIGPAIANLLRNNDVKSFAALAAMARPSIQAILNKGGSRFQVANPETWAEQAALAAANRWADLRRLQDELDAGVRRV